MCGLFGWISVGGCYLFAWVCSVWDLRPITYLPDYIADIVHWSPVLFIPLAWLSAILLGGIGQRKIKRSGGKITGRGRSIAGRIFGYAGIGILVYALVDSGPHVGVTARATEALSNAKQIGLGCKLYAVDHGHNYPQTLDDLFPNYIPDRKVFHCALGGDDERGIGFDYFGGKDTDPPDKVLLRSKITTKKGLRVVLRSDTSGAVEKEKPAP